MLVAGERVRVVGAVSLVVSTVSPLQARHARRQRRQSAAAGRSRRAIVLPRRLVFGIPARLRTCAEVLLDTHRSFSVLESPPVEAALVVTYLQFPIQVCRPCSSSPSTTPSVQRQPRDAHFDHAHFRHSRTLLPLLTLVVLIIV